MITVTEEAKEMLRDVEHPLGTVLRLDPVNAHRPNEIQLSLAAGAPKGDDQIVEYDGETLLHIARRLSQELNGGCLDLVQTPEGPAIGLKPPPTLEPLSDSS